MTKTEAEKIVDKFGLSSAMEHNGIQLQVATHAMGFLEAFSLAERLAEALKNIASIAKSFGKRPIPLPTYLCVEEALKALAEFEKAKGEQTVTKDKEIAELKTLLAQERDKFAAMEIKLKQEIEALKTLLDEEGPYLTD